MQHHWFPIAADSHRSERKTLLPRTFVGRSQFFRSRARRTQKERICRVRVDCIADVRETTYSHHAARTLPCIRVASHQLFIEHPFTPVRSRRTAATCVLD